MPGRPKAEILQNKDGSIVIQYKPTEKGVHELNLSCNEQAVDGTPFRCHVDSVAKGFVTAYGPGLNGGASGKDCCFTVVGDNVAISVDGPAKANITKKDTKNGLTSVTYVPVSPGEYEVSVKFKGKHIHGSPFSAKISGEGRKRSQVSMQGTSEIALGGKNVDLTGMVGILKTPGGKEEHCLLKRMPDGQLGIASFTPKNPGMHVVTVTQDGSPYPGSPFKVQVGEAQVARPGHVKFTDTGLKTPVANQWNKVGIDISDAGYGSVAVSVEGPHRSDIKCEPDGNKKYLLQFKPHEPGIYLCNVRFGDTHVPGSPFMLNVTGEPSGRIRETVVKDIAGVGSSCPGSKCEFQLKIPGTDPLDMEAQLASPTGKVDLCEIADLDESLYDIKFVPTEEGVHTVSLKHKGLHISGSPFQYTVGQPPNGGPHKVEIGGPGMERGEVGAKNEFNIYTREAGPGKLSVGIEGPSKAVLNVVDGGNGYTTVTYKVSKPGDYGVHVKYNGEHVPDSPAMVAISPESADAKKCTVHAIRDRGLDIDKPATFNVNLNGAEGEIHAHIDTPSGTEEDVFCQDIDKDLWNVRFMPKENGIYYVHVKLNEAHIPGSPFPMLVGKLGADPALVLAKGDGLEKGESGKQSKFTVVTTNAGTGTLNVNIEGPSKVAIMCTEVEEGYEFTYTPMAPGDYLIQIKYCNISLAGCPTMAKVTGRGKASEMIESSGLVVETVEKVEGAKPKKKFHGDATKVSARGNGLKKAFMNRPATYNVDVKGAGNAMLFVGIMSATGNPVTELTYKKQRGTVYTVNYRCGEKGDHQMSIRWGNEDIPGSPFTVNVS